MYDLTIVGGGLSGTLTLIYLLDELLATPIGAEWSPSAFHVAWIDRASDFGSGFAYGDAAHPKFLLNNDVSSMNVGGFHAWLGEHRSRWQARLDREADPAVQNWLSRHRESLDAARNNPGLYLGMFLPRCIFGMFLSDWLANSLDRARQRGVTIDLFSQRASAVGRESNKLHVTTREGNSLRTTALLIAVGSLPPDPIPLLETKKGFIHEWRMPDGGASLRETAQAMNRHKGRQCTAIIIGSHAAAIETLYATAHDSTLTELFRDICVISPSGRLPNAASAHRRYFRADKLPRLLAASQISAESLISAALADVEQGKHDGFTSADCSDAICDSFGKLFPLLSPEQKLCFVEQYGARFTALNRHTPPDYAEAAESLRKKGKLRTIAGKVVEITHVNDHFEVVVRHPGETESSEKISADIVINCQGAGLLSRSDDPFLRTLIDPQNGIARLNRSGLGIAVSSTFEASPGVFIIGPLLAGHSEGTLHLWNLERAERIEGLAKRTASILARRLLSGEPAAVTN